MYSYTIISAMGSNFVIGNNGKIPWHNSQELKLFRSLTFDSRIIVGYKTSENMPFLDNREVLVYSRTEHPLYRTIRCLEEGLYNYHHLQRVFLGGGGKTYKEALQRNLVSGCYLSIFDQSYEGDCFFPISYLEKWARFLVASYISFKLYYYKNPNMNAKLK